MTITNRVSLPIMALLVGISIILTLSVTNKSVSAAAPRDCDNNSIINCGTLTQAELISKYDKDTTKDLPAVFADYGLKRSDLTGKTSEIKMGRIYKDGRVMVNGKKVATGAHSIGRQDLPGSTKVTINGKTYYERLDTRNFQSDYISAIVMMRDGKFYRAVLTSCGNPVKATPVPEKPQPAAEKPAPVATPAPTPIPTADCTLLTAARIDRTRSTLSATASTTNGATISGYTFQVRNDNAAGTVVYTQTTSTTASSATSQEITLEPGTYYASVVVRTSLGDKTKDQCATTFTVAPPNKVEVCNPATGETMIVNEQDADRYKPVEDVACKNISVCEISTNNTITIKESEFDSTIHSRDRNACEEGQVLPSTGPADFIGGGLGIGSLTAAAYYWRASRRSLVSSLLSR